MKSDNITKDRHKFIGGSSISTIMGINPFKDRFTLLLEMAELKEIEFVDNEYVRYGIELEPKIRDYINETTDRKYKEQSLIKGIFRSNVDGADEDSILEIKTTSQIRKTLKGYKTYLVQLLHYMRQYDKQYGLLVVYERPKDFDTNFDERKLQTFEININDHLELVEEINKEIELFMEDLKIVKENPFITEGELNERIR